MSSCTPVPSGTYTFPTISTNASFAPITQTIGGGYITPVYDNSGNVTRSTTECQFDDAYDENYYVNVVSIDPTPSTFTFTETDVMSTVYSSTVTLTPNRATVLFDINLAQPENSLLYYAETSSSGLFITTTISNKNCLAIGSVFNGYTITKVIHFINESNNLDVSKVHYIEIDRDSNTALFNTTSVYAAQWNVIAGYTVKTAAGVLGYYSSTNKSVSYAPFFGGRIGKNNNLTEPIFTAANYSMSSSDGTADGLTINSIGAANELASNLQRSNANTNSLITASGSFSANFADLNATSFSASTLTNPLLSNDASLSYDEISYKLTNYSYNNQVALNPYSSSARKTVSYSILFAFAKSGEVGDPLTYTLDSFGNVLNVTGSVESTPFIAPDLSYQSSYEKQFIFRIQDSTSLLKTLFTKSPAVTTLEKSFLINEDFLTVGDTSNFLSSGYIVITAYELFDDVKYFYVSSELIYYNSKTSTNFTNISRSSSRNSDYNLNDPNRYYIIYQTKNWLDFDYEFNVNQTTQAFVLDIPYLFRSQSDGVWVISNTVGQSVYYSFDNETYALAPSTISTPIYGVIQSLTNLNINPQLLDQINTVTISPILGTFQSLSESQFLNNGGNILIGEELLRYKNAMINSDGSITLNYFVRGNNGTETFINNHSIGDSVYFIDPANTCFIPIDSENHINTTLYIKIGSKLNSITPRSIDYKAISLRPYAPTQITSSRNALGSVTALWERRDRRGANWESGIGTPLSESSEQYIVEIWNSSYTTLKRTSSILTTPMFTYSHTLQIDDFGSIQSSIAVKIYQLSSIYGRGIAAVATI